VGNLYYSRPNDSENDTQPGAKAGSDVPAEVLHREEHTFPFEERVVVDLLQVLLRRWWVICLTALVLAGVAVGISLTMTPEYEASTKILIGQKRVSGDSYDSLQSEVEGLQQITLTMVELVNSDPIANAVIQQLDLQITSNELRSNLTVEQVNATQIIQVNYTDPSPARAQRIANAVGDVFTERVSKMGASSKAVTAKVWERAQLPDKPVNSDPVRYGLIGFAVGALLGVALVSLWEHLDDNWVSPEELEQISGVPTYGVIFLYKFPKSKKPNSKKKVS
jgi:capsular polysaccharide biosynthesis protein